MSVVIRMKKMGRKNRHYFRICATDPRNPRDGRIIESLGTYDPHIGDTDVRVTFNADRLQYWLGVGAKPSEKVAVLIKKYGPSGTHLDVQKAAQEKLAGPKHVKDPACPSGPPRWRKRPGKHRNKRRNKPPPRKAKTPVPRTAAKPRQQVTTAKRSLKSDS